MDKPSETRKLIKVADLTLMVIANHLDEPVMLARLVPKAREVLKIALQGLEDREENWK